jgi:hypothetical protein
VSGLEPLGRVLLVLRVALAITGLVLGLGPRIPFPGRRPGDITFERGGTTISIPLATMLLISLVLSAVLSLIGRSG